MGEIPQWILFLFLIGSSDEGTKVLCRSSRNEAVLNFAIPEFRQKAKTKHKTQFVELSIPKVGITSDIGKPKLPVIRKFIEIPEDAEVTIETEILKKETIRLSSLVYPRQHPVPKIPNPIIEFAMDTDYYTRDEFFPRVRVQIAEIADIRGHRVAMVEIYPMLYNPSRNVVDFASEIQVTIRFHKADWEATRSKLERYYSIPYEAELKDIIVNYDYYKSCIKSPSLPIGYLIITPDSWYNTILPLAEWKKRKGYFVTVAKLSEVGSGDKDIVRDYIKNAYNNWSVPPTYVLLVGDVDKIDYFEGHIDGDVTTATDLYFSTMGGGGDYTPDLYLFRFSVASEGQLADLVNKTIKYERNDWSNGTDWCEKAYFVASEDEDYHDIAEGTHQYCMGKCRSHGMTCDSLWLWYGSGTGVSSALGNGRSWVMYSGHGYSGGWAETSCNPSWVAVDRVPFVGTFACNCGSYANSSCFSEKMIREGSSRGAITNFASSNYSYWGPDNAMQRAMFNAAFNSNITWAIGMFNSGRAAAKLHFGSKASKDYYEQYNMMGDGSVDIYWDVPHPITVTHPSTIVSGTADMEVTVKDGGNPVEGALVCASKSDTIFVGYTNSSGQVALSMENTTLCTLQITVTGHNLHTYEGTCIVLSAIEITIISPNNGEEWAGGFIHNVTWSCDKPDTVDHYRLLYSTNGGATYPDTIAHNIPNIATSYPWTLPVINLSTIRVKLEALNASNELMGWDESDDNFSIQIYPTVTSPDGSEVWGIGSTHPIAWSTVGQGFDSYRLLYAAIPPDSSWDTVTCTISSPHPYPNGYDSTWIISCPEAEKMKVHFSDFNTLSGDYVYLYDKDDNQIASYDGNIGAFWSSEVPGDTVKVRLVANIMFNEHGFDIDKYVAFHSEGGYLDTIASNISPDSNSWGWTLPDTSSTTCKVKVQILDAGSDVISEDESDDYFSIIEDTTLPIPFSLISPEDSAIFKVSRPIFIWFASSDLESGLHDYKVYIDGAMKYTGTDTSWTANYDLAEDYHSWYVVASDNADNSRESNETWTVLIDTTSPSAPPLISPANGSWQSDTSIAFKWGIVTKIVHSKNLKTSLRPVEKSLQTSALSGDSQKDNTSWQLEESQNESATCGKASSIRYILQIDTTDGFVSPIIVDTTQLTTDTLCLEKDKYWWRVKAYDLAENESEFSDIWNFEIKEVRAEITPILPRSYKLSQAYPSPGIREITIPYQLPEPTRTSLNIYDITGKLIHTLINTKQAPGYHSVVWNVRDMPNGIYFYKLDTPTFTQTKKLIILQ